MEPDSLLMGSSSSESEISGIHTDYKKKYICAMNRVQRLKQEVAPLKREKDRMYNILCREIGSDELVDKILRGKASSEWQGRAELIVELRKRIKDLSAGSSPSNVAIVVDHKRTHELEQSVEKIQDTLNETEKQRKALKSRNRILEDTLAETRADLRTLLEKDKINSELIAEMRARLTCIPSPGIVQYAQGINRWNRLNNQLYAISLRSQTWWACSHAELSHA